MKNRKPYTKRIAAGLLAALVGYCLLSIAEPDGYNSSSAPILDRVLIIFDLIMNGEPTPGVK